MSLTDLNIYVEEEPNAETCKAIDDVNNNRNMSKTFDSVKVLMKDLNTDN